MGRLHDRQHGDRTRVVPQWQKDCPDCGKPVARDTALSHLSVSHGASFRVEGWMHVLGMPESTFDELVAFVQKLKGGRQ